MTNVMIKDKFLHYFYTINQDKFKPNYYEKRIQFYAKKQINCCSTYSRYRTFFMFKKRRKRCEIL